MKCLGFVKGISYLLGFLIFCLGLYLLKRDFMVGIFATCIGLFCIAVIQVIPEPKVKRYKLTSGEIEEIIRQTENDAIEREVKFLDKERDAEIIETVSSWDFEESLIALHTIEHTHPNLTTGKEIKL